MRQVIGDILLVDIEFIKHVMLDWTVWETRLACWQHVWTRLCQSVSKENKFRHVNSQALLDHEVLQTAIRIPSVSTVCSLKYLDFTPQRCAIQDFSPYSIDYCNKLLKLEVHLMTCLIFMFVDVDIDVGGCRF